MTELHRPEDAAVYNERSLKKLAWAIQISKGQFKLILARCNYLRLRSQLVERLLQELHPADIRILNLEESEKKLYARIQAFLSEDVPAALMVFGLESVRDLEQLLTSSNQVREEFRKTFPFPLILWVNDEVLQKLLRLASDFESWATTVAFLMAPEDLVNLLNQRAAQFFTDQLEFTSETCLELEAAQKELRSDERVLDLELEANLESLLGGAKYINNQIEAALEHYQRGLALWQQSKNLERQGKLLSRITFCYYLKALQHREKYPLYW